MVELSPNGYIDKVSLKAQGALQKCGWKDYKNYMIRTFAVRLYILGMSEARSRRSHQHDCPNMT